MAEIIPVNSTGDRELQVLLGANLLTLRTYWNSTIPAWEMDIVDDAGNSLAEGLAMVPVVNMLAYSPTLTRTLGQFRVFTLDDSENVTETSLGDTCKLWWFAPGEWEDNEIESANIFILPFDVYEMYSTVAP